MKNRLPGAAAPAVGRRPQPPAELRARVQDALQNVFDVESVRLGLAVRPGEVPANVFDFDTGTRLIVSRDRFPDGQVFTHYSASVWPGTPDWHALRKAAGACGFPGFLRFYGEKIRELVPGERPALIGVTENGVPHWRSML